MGGLPCHSGAGGGLTRLVACRPCHHCPRRGACLLCRLPTLPLACFPAPYPPARARRALFPGGEGGDQGYFMQGAPPLASPAFNRLRHLQTFSNMNPAEGLPGWSPADLAAAVPAGGVLSLSPACPTFSLLPCPLSPSPFPNGEGEIYGYFMQGAPPLASPAFNRLRHLQTFSNMNPAGGLPGWSPADLAAVVPGGGACLPCRPPTLPLACFPAPYPPAPSPTGKGRFMVISCKGLRPLHPRG